MMTERQMLISAERAAAERAASAACRRRFETSTVGAVAAVEGAFGFLWGHGQRPSERTPSQAAWAEAWGRCRKEIFDVGNEQSRGLLEDLGKKFEGNR